MVTRYGRKFLVVILILAISLVAVQTVFAMQLPGLSVTLGCNDFIYTAFDIIADRDNTGSGNEAYRITITDGSGTVLHLVENLAGLPLGTYAEGGGSAGFNQGATALDNVRTYTWVSLDGNTLPLVVAYTTTNADCTGGAPPVPVSSFTYTTTFLQADFTDTSTNGPTGWAWDFGDGSNSTAQNPSHTYAAAGTYTVCLTASNGTGPGNNACQGVTVSAAPPPVPVSSFTYTTTFLQADFTDTSTNGPTGWAWDFGDGNNSAVQNPSHTYAAAGTYTVCLTASNGTGPGNNACQGVTVSAAPPPVPVSSFTYATTNLMADFTDTSTNGPTGWAWDFGDGNNSTVQNPSHTYAAAGTYNVCLIATNGTGPGNNACQNVTVSTAPPPVPVSSFTYTTTNLMADFTDTSTNGPTSWAWDFGDGNNSTAQNPSHTYAAAGTYNVCLVATNGTGPGSNACQNVTVAPGSTGGTPVNNSAPDPDPDGDGISGDRDNCPYDYNPDQEDGWGSDMGDLCDTEWYNRTGIGVSGFVQKDGVFHLHGNCIYLADGAPRCPVIGSFDPTQFDPADGAVEISSDAAGTWSVWVFYLHSNHGPDVYQVNTYSTNPPQPDTLVDDQLEIHVSGGSWRWYQRGGMKNYHGI